MSNKEAKKVLDTFYKNVISGAKKNLKGLDKNSSNNLSNSLDYTVTINSKGITSSLEMEDYGLFIDRGVKGVGGTKADGKKWKQKKVVKKTGERGFKYTTKRPPTKVFDKWAVRRGIAPRSKGGQFISRDSLKFALANSVFHTGIETTFFYSAPLDKYYAKLPDQLAEAYGKDIDLILEL